jgi:hypothetical protein
MRKVGCRTVLIAFFAMAVPLAMSSDASAQYRAFAGKVKSISSDEIRVDNRKGDEISFVRTDATVVEGEKTSWRAIEKNDWVSVSWKMMDAPRVAYRIVVMPPKKEADR